MATFTGALVGSELIPIVSPGNAASGVNYNMTTLNFANSLLSSLINATSFASIQVLGTATFSAGPVIINGTTQSFPSSGDIVGAVETATLTNKTLNSAILNNPALNTATFNNATINTATINNATLNTAVLNNPVLNTAILGTATLNTPTIASATFTGTQTLPDGTLWGVNGISAANGAAVALGALTFAAPAYNLTLAAMVNGNALTVTANAISQMGATAGVTPTAANPVLIGFRSNTISYGYPTFESVTSALSITIASGNTLGMTNGSTSRLYVVGMNNAGSVALALYNGAGSSINEDLLQTSAVGTAGGNSTSIFYASQSGLSNVAVRIIGYMDIAETTAGLWAAGPTMLKLFGGSELSASTSSISTSTFTTLTVLGTAIFSAGPTTFNGTTTLNAATLNSAIINSSTLNYPVLLFPQLNSANILTSSLSAPTIASATFTGTQALPDGNTWGVSGIVGNGLATAPVNAASLAVTALSFLPAYNLTLEATVQTNALSVTVNAVSTSGATTGVTPTAANPVLIGFRSNTISYGYPTFESLTSALSITIASGNTMGTISGQMARLWIVAMNNAGSIAVALYNALQSVSVGGWNINGINEDVLQSSASGTTGGSSVATYYASQSSLSNVAIRILGYLEIQQQTAGTWATAPNIVKLFGPGALKPGETVQIAWTNSSAITTTNLTATYATVGPVATINPFSAANLIKVNTFASIQNASTLGAGTDMIIGKNGTTQVGYVYQTNSAGTAYASPIAMEFYDAPNTTGLLSYGACAKITTGILSYPYIAGGAATVSATEIQV